MRSRGFFSFGVSRSDLSSSSTSSGLLLGFGLCWGGRRLLCVRGGSKDESKARLVQIEDVLGFHTEGRIDGGGERGWELVDSDEGDVRKSDALHYKVRVGNEVPFEDSESESQAVLEHDVDRFVLRSDAPLTSWRMSIVTGDHHPRMQPIG